MRKAGIWGFGLRSDSGLAAKTASPTGPRRRGSAADAAEALLLMKNYEESGQGWFWSTGPKGQLTYISDCMAELLADQHATLLGCGFSDLFEQAQNDLSGRTTLPFLLAKQSAFEKITVRASLGGGERCWSISGNPQFDRSGRFTGYRGSAVDVTEQRRTSEHVSQLAKYDSLTGLPNRRLMSEVLDGALTETKHRGRACSVLLIDLDRFKQVNDTLGHPAGDALLKQVAERLSRIVGDRERVFRLGGDEFQVILPNCEDRGIIGDLAAEIISNLSQPYSVEGSRCSIGASVGIAVAPADGSSRPDLIRNADLALYASKSGGRGRFRFFSTDLLEAAEDKRALEEDLRDALARGEISLEYQPIVNATTDHMTGVEALLRWNHPARGPISPALFIPIAEEAGLIARFGEWALRQACNDAATWPGELRVAVNVSPIQFTSETLPATIMSALAASGLSPDRLELEITEGVFLGKSSTTDLMFAALKKIGVRLALDDFGTGYSSLGYLRTAPFDKIKIDQTFVRDATLPDSRNSAIIAAIVALAEALGMETTAEGIEYMDQLQLVRRLRVSHAQGWVYSQSLSDEALREHLRTGEFRLKPSGPSRQRSDRQATYRKVGVIHANRYHNVIMRNLSESGALIDGIPDLPLETLIVVDFGDGQLTFARVRRSKGRQQGVAFEQDLVDDGNGGLCTSHRVSPYLLKTAGLPSPGEPDRDISTGTDLTLEELAAKLGLKLSGKVQRQVPVRNLQWSSTLPDPSRQTLTIRELSERYLESAHGDEIGDVERDLREHILPQFGELSLDRVSRADISAWLSDKAHEAGHPPGTDHRLHTLLGQLWTLAVELNVPSAGQNTMDGSLRLDRRGQSGAELTADEARTLLEVAGSSNNRQLKYILSLMMLTGARQRELLNAKWEHLDLSRRIWFLDLKSAEKARELRLSAPALIVLEDLPRWDGCPYLIANPTTLKPYQSVMRSWDMVSVKAGLPHLEIDDLRYCDLGTAVWDDQLLDLVRNGRSGQTAEPVRIAS
ncbi:MAG TPA: EAL domain-containing protein [Allosphingosinicella sp.]|jgi:diguanylate cyclase (GGDEF)-like protein